MEAIESHLITHQTMQASVDAETAALSQELEALRTSLIALAEKTQDNERSLTALDSELKALRVEETQTLAALKTRKAALDRLIATVLQLASLPPEAVLAMPGSLDDTILTHMILSGTIADLREETAAMEATLSSLANLRDTITTTRDRRRAEQTELAAGKAALDVQIARRRELIARLQADRSRLAEEIAALTQKSNDLQDLLKKLERARTRPAPVPVAKPKPEGAPVVTASRPRDGTPDRLRSFAQAKGALGLPVAGRIATRFGELNDTNDTARGITIEARSGARVVSPFDGEVVFTGPFLGYGNMLILRHSGEYHTLVAGLERIDAVVGQYVLEGEPIGAMGTAQDTDTRLYMEVRKNSKPINPGPWLKRGATRKGSG